MQVLGFGGLHRFQQHPGLRGRNSGVGLGHAQRLNPVGVGVGGGSAGAGPACRPAGRAAGGVAEAARWARLAALRPRLRSVAAVGWAVAAAACIALAVNLYSTQNRPTEIVTNNPTPTPIQLEKLDPQQQRLQLMNSPEVVKADFGKGNVKEMAEVSGDVVWSPEKQAGYMRLKGLPKNDTAKQTYQLWIFDPSQSEKTPIDGGTFDINSDGEVIIPIDAKLRATTPAAFAVTIEKAGGVVVSDRGKIAALAAVKPNQS